MLTRVAGNCTELLTSAGTRIARRQSPRQVVPTGLLHRLIVVASGRICFEANTTSRVGKILRQRVVMRAKPH